MIRKTYTLLIGILVIVLVLFFRMLMVGFFFEPENRMEISRDYKVEVLIGDRDLDFWKNFMTGANKAANELNMSVDYVEARNEKETKELINKGIYSGKNGIAFMPFEEKNQDLMSKAKNWNIPMVIFEYSPYDSVFTYMVGNDSYEIGMEYCVAIRALGMKDNSKITILTKKTDKKSQYLQGIKDASESFGGNYATDEIRIQVNKESALDDLKKALDKKKENEIVISTDSDLTKLLIRYMEKYSDLDNKVVLTYGSTIDVKDKIVRGDIKASICPKAYMTGYETMYGLASMVSDRKEKKELQEHKVNTGLYILTKDNVENSMFELEGIE